MSVDDLLKRLKDDGYGSNQWLEASLGLQFIAVDLLATMVDYQRYTNEALGKLNNKVLSIEKIICKLEEERKLIGHV